MLPLIISLHTQIFYIYTYIRCWHTGNSIYTYIQRISSDTVDTATSFTIRKASVTDEEPFASLINKTTGPVAMNYLDNAGAVSVKEFSVDKQHRLLKMYLYV